MINIVRNGIVRREVWFDGPWETTGADLLVFYSFSQPMGSGKARDVYSLEIDLQRQEAEIWKDFKSNTRNEINRSKKDGARFEVWPNPTEEVLGKFLESYRAWAIERGRYGGDPVWMSEYAQQGALMLTRVTTTDGTPLAWHSHYRSATWVRLLHSISQAAGADSDQRKMIGQANRYLHWMDMLEYRRQGIAHFDFGGWYHGDTDEKLLRINSFKEGFGGAKTHRYHSMRAVSLKGVLFLKARALLKRNHDLVHFV